MPWIAAYAAPSEEELWRAATPTLAPLRSELACLGSWQEQCLTTPRPDVYRTFAYPVLPRGLSDSSLLAEPQSFRCPVIVAGGLGTRWDLGNVTTPNYSNRDKRGTRVLYAFKRHFDPYA